MRTRVLGSRVRGRAALALTSGIAVALAVGGFTPARAANPSLPAQFSGLLNDYTPGAAPYEMHGKWTLDLNVARGTATFTAEMTMEFADFANSDPTGGHDPTKLNAHTHHISVTDGIIHNDSTGGDPVNWVASCPKFSPAAQGGFVVTGLAYVTANGTNPPAPLMNPTPVTICVLGGISTGVAGSVSVTYSNFTMTFQAPGAGLKNASSHFGTQAINGVVSKCELAPGLLGAVLPSSACSVAVVND